MTTADRPLVSILIPVYNGEAFIAEAIRSVLAQTYPRLDLTIVNNMSTDRTRQIAAEFAKADSRIRIHDNDSFLEVVDNHSRAVSLASSDAKYVKILGADDWLFPHCIAELVAVAESNPTVGMVTSYVLAGSRVAWDGLPFPSTCISGREVCRQRLLNRLKVFGGTSASLIRADITRKKRPFFNPLNYHGDTEAYLELLQESDFGYVHQVLSYNRKGEDSRTASYLERVDAYYAFDVYESMRFGPVYLTEREARAHLRTACRAHYRALARAVFEFKGREYWHFHLVYVRRMGYKISLARLGYHVAARILDMALNPKRTLESVAARLFRSQRPTDRAAVQSRPKPASK